MLFRILLEVYRRTTDGSSGRGGWDWEGAYKKTFENSEREWSVAFEVDNDGDHSEYEYDQRYAIPASEIATGSCSEWRTGTSSPG